VSYLGVTSVATETQILNVSQSIAATGHTVGLSTEEVLGLSAAFASLAVSPEQARSAMARLFLNLDKAVSNNGKELQVWASLLGTSVDQVKFLRATNPDELFNSIISAFHNVQQSGGDLTGVFTDLGLKSIRDIQVFERLANGFDVVTNSLQNAGKAFADGTYLSESFAIVNETVAAKAQKVADAFRNMLAGIGGNSVVQNVIKGILDGILNLLEAFNKLPTGVRTALGTFISLLGVFAAYKASMALLTAGLLAFRQAQGGGINAATVGFRTLLREANLAFGGAAKAAAAYAAASTAAGKAAASSAGGIAAQTAALGANAAAGTAATVSKGAGAAGTVAKGAGSVASVAGAAGGVLAGITKSFGPVLVISSVISLVAGLVSAFHQQDQAAVSAAENLQKYGASLLEAGGGAQSLIDAMNKDQASFEKVGGSTQKLDGYFGKVVEHFGAIENGVSKVTRTFYDMNGVATDLGSRFVATGKAQDDYASSQKGVQSSVKNTNKTLQDQVTILGANSEKWLQNAISNELTADNSPLKPQDLSNLLTAFGASGLTLGQAIADGVTQGAGKLASDVAPILDGLKQQIEINTGEIRAKYSVMLNPDLHPDLTLQDRTAAEAKMAAETDAANKPLNDQIAAIQVLTDMINGGTSALGGLADKQTLLNQIAAAFPPIADDMSGSGADVTNTFDDLNTKVQTTTQQMQAAASAFTAMLGLLTDTADASLAVSDSMAALGKSIADNGTEFDQYTEGGRKNLHALLDVVGAVGKQLAGEVANGQITAEQAAEAMQTYMTNLTQQLGQIGVPTDQITFLVNYLSSVVSTKWGINIGADISAAMTGINTVAVAAQQAQAYINGLGTTYANMADVDKAGRLSAGGYAGLAGQVQSAAPVYSGPTSFYGSNAGVLDAAKAQEDAANASKAASAATKDASKSAKDAATTAKDAAQAAKDAADAQTRYLQAAGAYFASFAKDSLTMVDSIGNTVEALQKLGQAIAENGTAFNVVTEGGRANWTALEAVFTDFGNTLQTEVTNGTLSAADALAQYQQMAGGVYSELIALGVPAADIDAWFKSMGMDTTGWDNANAAVAAYAGFITAAYDATGEFMKQTDKTADYVQRLTDALNTQATAYWGLQDAQDGVATQFNQMKKAQDDNATSIADLIAKNKELNATIGDQTVIANKAYANYLLAKKYGETGRAADYLQQYNDAKGQITTAQGQVKTNTAQVATLKASKNLLTGNSQAAIDNRKSLQDLTNTYTTQIEAYAAAGHTQAEVAAYAKTLKEQFDAQATSLGYTRDQLKPYNTELDNIVTTIGKIPATVSTTVSADTTAASAALGAIPTSGSYKISTLVDAATVTTTKQTLKNIPNKADYKVTASANTVPATTALGKIPKTGGYAITPTVSALTATQKANLAAGLPKNFNLEAVLKIRDAQVDTMWSTLQTQLNKKANQTPLYITGTLVAGPGGTGHIYTGGQVAAVPMTRGYAEGGLLPGTPPANPTVDNLMATGPQGIYHLRSREFIQSQPAVDYYGVGVMNALNQRMIPRNRFMASGGSVGGGGGGGVGWDGPVELSMADRQLLRQIRDAQPNVYVGDSAVAHSSARGAETNSRRGGY
jgi:hypothetical protein